MAKGFGNTWWGSRWLLSLTHIDYENRIPRGATYARAGAVRDVKVTNAEGLSYRGMKMVANLVNEVMSNKRLNPKLRLAGVVVTRYEKNNLSDMYLEKIEKDLGPLLIKPVIRKSTKIAQSASFQQNIYEYDPTGRATQDYLSASNELLQRIELQNFGAEQ